MDTWLEKYYDFSSHFRWHLAAYLKALKEIPQLLQMELQNEPGFKVWFREKMCSLRDDPKVIALLGAAAREPAACETPDALDIGRKEKSHLSFGRGIHYFLGASQAMLEVRIDFRGLLGRFPSIRIVAKPW